MRAAGRALLALALAASAAGAQARPALKWGGDAEGGAPFVEADPADPRKVRGFDVEVAELIARGLGRTPQFVQVAWAQVAASVDRGDFTLGLSGLEDRLDVRARYAVTIPYYEFHEVLSVRPGDAGKYRSLADLKEIGRAHV